MPTPSFDWVNDYPAAVSVCDIHGTIIAMNRLATDNFSKQGGEALLGTSLFACHPEPANIIIRRLLQEQTGNTYFTKKNGVCKLVHQAPWFNEGRFAGLTETVIVLPDQVPTKQRS